MKQFILIPTLLLLFSLVAVAQSPNAARATRSTMQMSKQIQLSDEQFEKVNNAYLTMYRGFERIRDAHGERTIENPLEEGNKLKAVFNNTLTIILTENQLTAWNNYTAQKKVSTPIDTDRIDANAARKATRMTKELDLTPQQEQEVLEAYANQMIQLTDLRALSKKEPKATKEERKKIDAAFEATISNILTDEQKEKRQKLKEERLVKKETLQKKQKQEKLEAVDQEKIVLQKAEAETKHITNRLGLDKDQASAYRALARAKHMAFARLEKKKSSMTEKEIDDYENKIMANFNINFENLLTDAQRAKLKTKVD